jgi:gas vesicle protein
MNGLKNARQLSRVVLTFLAGILLILNVACSNVPEGPKVTGEGSYDEQRGFQTELYDDIQPKRGGMNNYEDDFRDSSPGVKAKTRELIDHAKRTDKIDSPQDFAREARQSAKELGQNVSERAERQKNDFVESTKQGTQNLKENLGKASREVPEIVREATGNAKESAQGAADTVKESVKAVKESAEMRG